MNAFLPGLVILLILLPGSQVQAFQGEPDGFRGIPWGAPVESLQGFILVSRARDRQEVSLYRREGDDLTFGRAQLKSILYEFAEGRLSRVEIRVDDIWNFVLLRDALFRLHGPGKELSPGAERYGWEGVKSRVLLLSNFDIS
jgi:hypothetical protein